jgi:CubicO group peptidase (beta-lactamase class C family)
VHGLSIDKLSHVRRFLPRYVAEGKLPGYLCLISRRGHEALFDAHGLMDVERQRPVTRDTVFRIYSMTKPITSVALMMLYERGLFQLDDPVARYVPQWNKLKVFAGGDADSFDVRDPDRPMTVKDLLTHTSGLTYGFLHAHPVDAMYRAAGVGGMDKQGTLQSMIDTLAELPLQFSPGAALELQRLHGRGGLSGAAPGRSGSGRVRARAHHRPARHGGYGLPGRRRRDRASGSLL